MRMHGMIVHCRPSRWARGRLSVCVCVCVHEQSPHVPWMPGVRARMAHTTTRHAERQKAPSSLLDWPPPQKRNDKTHTHARAHGGTTTEDRRHLYPRHRHRAPHRTRHTHEGGRDGGGEESTLTTTGRGEMAGVHTGRQAEISIGEPDTRRGHHQHHRRTRAHRGEGTHGEHR